MKRLLSFVALLLVATLPLAAHAETRLRMSTTTSTDNSGLLNVLLPPFEKENNCRVDVIAVGTGKALKLGANGDVDVVFVHARAAEDKFVADGYGVNRRSVMHNDFVLVGPPSDPDKVKEATTAVDAFRRIAAGSTPFISRGDDSGTNKKEIQIWKAAGIQPSGNRWYSEAGQGMGQVLQMANEKLAYTLSDRGTFIAYKSKVDLVILNQGDPILFNPYGVIAVNPAKYPEANYGLAMKFIAYVTGREGQKVIAGYKMHGQQLFYPDAIPNP